MTIGTDRDHHARLIRLVEVCRNLGAIAELEAVFQTVVNAACELTESQASTILLYEEETDLLKFVAGPPVKRDTSRRMRVPLEKSLAGMVYTQSKTVVVYDAHHDPRILREVETPFGVALNNIAAAPMRFRGETIGVLEVVNKRGNAHYTEEDVTILETLASQAAVATLGALLLDEVKHAYGEVNAFEKMKSDFIAITSHELRTPLGLILGHATFLIEAAQNETQRNQLEVIIRSATRLKKIIDDLSNISQTQRGLARVKRKPIVISTLIARVVATFQDSARRKRISLSAKLPESELTIDGDEEKISLVLSNLLANAISFTNDHGHVLVSAEKLPGYVKLAVVDDGIGIPAKDLPRVFERFFQVQSHLTRRHGGMGLGLSVAKAMVELHGGEIWAESVEGKGSNFSFLLPQRGGQPLVTKKAEKVKAFVDEV